MEAEKPSQELFVFEGLPIVPEGDNLFVQEPFRQIVQGISERSRGDHLTVPILPDTTIRSMLTTIASGRKTQREDSELSPSEVLELNLERFAASANLFYSYYKIKDSSGFADGIYGRVFVSTFQGIDRDIRIKMMNYIQAYGYNHIFANDGEDLRVSKTIHRKKVEVPSFGEWYMQSQERDARIKQLAVRVVVEEAFSSTPQSSIDKTGKRPLNKRYRFLRQNPSLAHAPLE